MRALARARQRARGVERTFTISRDYARRASVTIMVDERNIRTRRRARPTDNERGIDTNKIQNHTTTDGVPTRAPTLGRIGTHLSDSPS